MNFIDYVEIENFKGLDKPVRIQLSNPSVLIGPNNAGKTTVLQALSLWSRAVRAWLEKKGSGHTKAKRDSVGINRLLIMDIPVKETRYFWNATRLRDGAKNIGFAISVGVKLPDCTTRSLRMEFSYRDPESLYSKPADSNIGDSELLDAAGQLQFNLLYPMSGLASGVSETTEETLLPDGRVNVLLGQGQTAQVLRNLCYQVWYRAPDDWARICEIVEHVFRFKLNEPKYDESRGALSLAYRQYGMQEPLELVLAGRGVQQMLLILAYLYSHKGGILMIDEPDAHLEILRQKQIFMILKDVADATNCQIVIATHSEVILDEAFDTNLTCIANGTAAELSERKEIKMTLRNLGVEHYYNASLMKRLLIVEGSTDVEMLRAFAKKLGHPAKDILSGPLFTFYTQDVNPRDAVEDNLEKIALKDVDYRQYYSMLRHLVPELRAIAVLDSDSKKGGRSQGPENLTVVRWKRYELENYFITPERLSAFLTQMVCQIEGELFGESPSCAEDIKSAVDGALVEFLFEGDGTKVDEYYTASETIKEKLLAGVKMSAFAEKVFANFSAIRKCSILLNKGGFYRLIELMDPSEVPSEVKENLDLVYEIFKPDVGG